MTDLFEYRYQKVKTALGVLDEFKKAHHIDDFNITFLSLRDYIIKSDIDEIDRMVDSMHQRIQRKLMQKLST